MCIYYNLKLCYCKGRNFHAVHIFAHFAHELRCTNDVSENLNDYKSNGIKLLYARKFAHAKMLNRD